MKKTRKISGFTMAELLIVVAIIAVLSSVGFIAVQNHKKNLDFLENETIAKEIFVAAQNHLTMANSQGYLDVDVDEATLLSPIDTEKAQQIHVVTNTESKYDKMLGLMLPFGSIDETIRAGGRYYIRFQTNPAQVLDVFYWASGDVTYNNSLLELRDNANNRKNNDPMIGWYGGVGVVSMGKYMLNAPTIKVINGEMLSVEVTDNNDTNIEEIQKLNPILKLIVEGNDSHAQISFLIKRPGVTEGSFVTPSFVAGSRFSEKNDVSNKYTIVLDDITSQDMHFVNLNEATSETSGAEEIELAKDVYSNSKIQFRPGEDITIYAVAYSNSELSNIAYSSSWTTNSLYASIEEYKETDEIGNITKTGKEAIIANFRHLENLDVDISKVDVNALEFDHAKQIDNLDWNEFKKAINKESPDNVVITYISTGSTGISTDKATEAGTYKPVNVLYLLTYDGGVVVNEEGNIVNHIVKGVKTNWTGSAGLFEQFSAKNGNTATIKNLTLIDFDIVGSGNAGALAGTLKDTNVSNVLARHESGFVVTLDDGTTKVYRNVTSSEGNAGGLVGDMTGGRVEQCAAALYVQGQTAGGLLGSANVTSEVTPTPLITIAASYSGGHTFGGKYIAAETGEGHFNVIGSTIAGGLIGDAKNTTINSCYSTCSATCTDEAATATGGLIGSAGDNKDVLITYSYATGLIQPGDKAGAILGAGELSTDSKDIYYSVCDIRSTVNSGAPVAEILPSVDLNGDEKTKPYIPSTDELGEAVPYDSNLDANYQFITIEQLRGFNPPKTSDAEGEEESTRDSIPDFITKHYGDWSVPEDLKTDLTLLNAEKLTAKVAFDKQDIGQRLTMLVKGETSGQTAYLVFEVQKDATKATLSAISKIPKAADEYLAGDDLTAWSGRAGILLDTTGTKGNVTIDLDSITKANAHFAQLFPTFIPGENIIVAAEGNVVSQAEMEAIFTGKTVTKGNPVYADGINRVRADITNSLFADPTYEDEEGNTVEGTDVNNHKADIANFRHLENLDKAISGLGGEENIVSVSSAVQINNMDWKEDWNKGWANATVYRLTDTTENSSNKGLFVPVDPGYKLDYDGKRNSITGIKVDCDGNAGLFGALNVGNSSVSNLALIDFDINGGGNAGALAGALTNTKVSNVVVYHSKDFSVTLADDSKVYRNVTSTGGDAGGLVGSMTGGSVDKCAAALYVNGSKNAGGLIGTTSDVEVTGSYSGGHTSNGEYLPSKVTSDKAHINVIGTVNAGGLIGQVNGKTKTVENCYSTCSVSGGTVGGFVGQSSAEIVSCYATGLVEGTTKGAFAGSLTGSYSKNLYYEIINEVAGGDYPYLKAVGNKSNSEVTGVTALDADAVSYDKFVGNPGNWENASAYDKTALDKLFGTDKYSLKTVAQLGATVGDGDFVATHYGDWPAPEALVINTGSAD